MQKRRFNFAFNLENNKHARAYEILNSYPNRHRCEFVIQSILEHDDCEKLKKLIYEAVFQAVSDLNVDNALLKESPELNEGDLNDNLDEIPDDALSYLISL